MSKVLVVYYSRTGKARKIAEEIAAALQADVEAIVDSEDRSGLMGYLMSGFDGLFARAANIVSPAREPADYDLVIVGTPVWVSSMSAPVKAYLERMHSRFRHRVAFFLVHGGTGARRVFLEMEELSGKAPLEVLAIRDSDWESGRHTARVAAFAQALARHLAPAHAVA